MITDLEEIKRRLRAGRQLLNRGNGWFIGRTYHVQGVPTADAVPADLVALLSAQGLIRTELRVVGSAHWVAP
jgi:hypothetical protein